MQNNIVRNYRIGDLGFRYVGPEFAETEYLKVFRSDDLTGGTPRIVYEMIRRECISVPADGCIHQDRYIDIYENGEERIRIIYDRKKEHVILKDTWRGGAYHSVEYDAEYMTFWDSNMMMKIFDIPNQVMLWDGIFLHASCVVHHGQAIVFTAPKQIGKSTQAALWETHKEAEIINGDRVLLRKKDDRWIAYGSPYAGTSRIFKNLSAQVSAIVVLSQGQENTVSELSTFDALKALMDGCSYEKWDRTSVMRVVDIADNLLKDIRFVKLECLPDVTAVETLEDFLCQLKKEE